MKVVFASEKKAQELFVKAALDMVDARLMALAELEANPYWNSGQQLMLSANFRTLVINGGRRAGHTTIAKKLVGLYDALVFVSRTSFKKHWPKETWKKNIFTVDEAATSPNAKGRVVALDNASIINGDQGNSLRQFTMAQRPKLIVELG